MGSISPAWHTSCAGGCRPQGAAAPTLVSGLSGTIFARNTDKCRDPKTFRGATDWHTTQRSDRAMGRANRPRRPEPRAGWRPASGTGWRGASWWPWTTHPPTIQPAHLPGWGQPTPGAVPTCHTGLDKLARGPYSSDRLAHALRRQAGQRHGATSTYIGPPGEGAGSNPARQGSTPWRCAGMFGGLQPHRQNLERFHPHARVWSSPAGPRHRVLIPAKPANGSSGPS